MVSDMDKARGESRARDLNKRPDPIDLTKDDDDLERDAAAKAAYRALRREGLDEGCPDCEDGGRLTWDRHRKLWIHPVWGSGCGGTWTMDELTDALMEPE